MGRALARQCRAMRDELAFLAPWAGAGPPPEGLNDLPNLDAIPTLRDLAGLALALSTP